MFDERMAIQQELEFNRQERINANNRYWDERKTLREQHDILMNRLRELDDIERGVETTTKKTTTISIEEHMRIMKEKNGMAFDLNVSQNNRVADYLEEQPEKTSLQEHQIRAEVFEQQDEDSAIRNKKNIDLKKVASIVVSILKEKGVPLKQKDIFKILEEEHNLTWNKNSYSCTIKTMMDYELKIQKASFGYYQYKF